MWLWWVIAAPVAIYAIVAVVIWFLLIRRRWHFGPVSKVLVVTLFAICWPISAWEWIKDFIKSKRGFWI